MQMATSWSASDGNAEQGARRDQCGVAAQVRAAHRVRAATAGIGVAGLAVRRHHDHQQQRHRERDPPGQVQQGQAAEAEYQHDLLGGVRD
jgi:hypothetical protein